MAVPKGKTSKARKHSRSANWKIDAPTMVECPHCHELKQSHRACDNCGYYGGKEIVAQKQKSAK
ncbi:MAG TPA: 50S ribosomal protein L32 [Candidatus Ornithoclostridium faecavium]|nr:50S ribosomal protein L32 [Candidatus Ornithoclostridium faecavium]